jgi:hypothetical protein
MEPLQFKYLFLAAIGSVLAGLSHMILQSMGHVGIPFYFYSFIIIGLLQVALGVLVFKHAVSEWFFWVFVLLNGGATVFWFMTRTVSTPFIDIVEPFTLLGVTVVALQILSMGIVMMHHSKALKICSVIVFSFFAGVGAHSGATQLETIAPGLKGTGEHSHGEGKGGHDHGKEDKHNTAHEHKDDANDLHNTEDDHHEYEKQQDISNDQEEGANSQNNTKDDEHDHDHEDGEHAH